MHVASPTAEAAFLPWALLVFLGPLFWAGIAAILGFRYEVLGRYVSARTAQERRAAAWLITAVLMWPVPALVLIPRAVIRGLLCVAAVLTTGYSSFRQWRAARTRAREPSGAVRARDARHPFP